MRYEKGDVLFVNQMNENQIATVEKINQVAFRYFLEKGYEATNLRQVSAEVGIKAASIYFYYESKQKLFFAILENVFERQMNLIQEMKRQKGGESAKEQMYFMY